jgi:hypothetical protein
LFAGILIVTLALLAATTALLSLGGRADPPGLRAAATLLDGPWRFHVGDDPHWAAPATDDGTWETTNLTAPPGSHDGDVGLPDYVSGWMARGHPGYTGYGWYRRGIDVPAGPRRWDILGPTAVEDGYELYWNGALLGGSGRIGAKPRLVGVRPLRFALPADAAGTHGVLAIRVFMLSRAQPGSDEGGVRSPPILAPRPVSDGLHRAHWARTIAGYVVDAIEPLAMVAVIGLALLCGAPARYRGFLVFASIALALTALRRLDNALVSWTDVMDLTTYSWLAKYTAAPIIGAWALAWNRWCARPWRLVDAAAVLLALAGIAGAALNMTTLTNGSRIAAILLFALIGVRIARNGPMRGLALVALALILVTLFGGELLDPIGVPGIWFPFGIGVSRTQYLYAAVLPLLAVLIVRSLEQVDQQVARH